MSKSAVVISTKTKPPKRSLAEKLGITLVGGGKARGSDLVMALVMFL